MIDRIRRTAALALHQSTVTLGILAMPLALLVRRLGGVTLPIHRLVERTGAAVEGDQ